MDLENRHCAWKEAFFLHLGEPLYRLLLSMWTIAANKGFLRSHPNPHALSVAVKIRCGLSTA
jgi:hypothetical protein